MGRTKCIVIIQVPQSCYRKKMNGKEEEIYKILYEKKEINDKTPNLRTEDDKKMLKSLSYKIRKFPKDLIADIKKKFPSLQKPKTAEQRKEQDKECHSRKRSAESEIERQRRLNKLKEYVNEKRSAESDIGKER